MMTSGMVFVHDVRVYPDAINSCCWLLSDMVDKIFQTEFKLEWVVTSMGSISCTSNRNRPNGITVDSTVARIMYEAKPDTDHNYMTDHPLSVPTTLKMVQMTKRRFSDLIWDKDKFKYMNVIIFYIHHAGGPEIHVPDDVIILIHEIYAAMLYMDAMMTVTPEVQKELYNLFTCSKVRFYYKWTAEEQKHKWQR